ncbi:MAG: hypothetical protein MUO53_06870 [Maribacter sp.]|nr:hypothetical protein [Maribacter sp.]
MKTIFLWVLLGTLHFLHGQKIIKKTILNPNISLIQIDANNCYEIRIKTAKSEELSIEAVIDGEYNKDQLVSLRQQGAGILIETGFQPNFIAPNDKLSAHKVISISLTIRLPEDKNVEVFGTNSTVRITGTYENLKVVLDDGRCYLEQVSRSAVISTKSGDIIANCAEGTINALSKYGTVHRDSIPQGKNYYSLTSTTGNISIHKTK